MVLPKWSFLMVPLMVLLSGLGLPLVGFMVDWLSVMVLVGCFCKDRNYPFLSFSGFAVSWCWLVWSLGGLLVLVGLVYLW